MASTEVRDLALVETASNAARDVLRRASVMAVLVRPHVEALEGVHRDQPSERLPVAGGTGQRRLANGLGAQPQLRATQDDARDQPLDVPLPGAGRGLVEVVHVEHQAPLGRRVQAEVAQVRVTADDHVDAGDRLSGEVVGHQPGRATIEREGTHRHPLAPQRHQVLEPTVVLRLDQRHRIAVDRA